jgi:carboxymethylenebutenolidase
VDVSVRIRSRLLTHAADGAAFPVRALWLSGEPRGAVILLVGADASDFFVDELMNEMAEHGYESVAAVADGDDRHGLAVLSQLRTVLDQRNWSADQIGVVGYGAGGRISALAAGAEEYGAAVSVAPRGPERSGPATLGIRTPWLCLRAGLDTGSGMGDLPDDGPNTLVYSEAVRYENVGADYFLAPARALAHAAAYDTRQRIFEWLDAHVAPRPTALAVAWAASHHENNDRPHAGAER